MYTNGQVLNILALAVAGLKPGQLGGVYRLRDRVRETSGKQQGNPSARESQGLAQSADTVCAVT
jgi:hypothetical protein